jgi:AbrB family looped-hinge helix DNA binding protein
MASQWHFDAMKATIDKAGRIVIPAAIREKVGLRPGTLLEVTVDDFTIRIVAALPPPKLVRRGKRLVAQPTAKRSDLPRLDVTRLVEEERDRWP